MRRVIVGVSGFAGEHPAIAWAMQFAARHSAAVELVHVVDATWGLSPDDHAASAILLLEEQLRDHERLARDAYPQVMVQSHLRVGSPTNELVAASEEADLLVISAHPDDRDSGASRRVVRLATLSHCSVVVVPSAVIPTGAGIVVGVDGSVESDLAVQFGAEIADAHQETLTVVLAWGQPEGWAAIEPFLTETEPSEDDKLTLAESVAGLASRYPDLRIETQVSASRPERALQVLATDARMIVVGSKGRHGVARALLGSVSEAVVSDLTCAVAVVRATREPDASAR
jgi:nucleotide-binding universal stress UspA family protein